MRRIEREKNLLQIYSAASAKKEDIPNATEDNRLRLLVNYAANKLSITPLIVIEWHAVLI
jgi:hypothetical protein